MDIEPRQSKRGEIEENFGDDFITYLVEGDPISYTKGINSSDAPFW